jgi:hypothetical protein
MCHQTEVAHFSQSAHGVALSQGIEGAPTCINCHGGHDVRRPTDPRSLVNKFNIPQTCAKCHADVTRVYNESIHRKAILQGNTDAPVCTDCHGEHQILSPTNPRSRVSARSVSVQVCASCHSSVQLTQKYAIAGERFKAFEDSYHGLASREGSAEVANCASCHEYHNIKPSSDPTSTVNKANLRQISRSRAESAIEARTKTSQKDLFTSSSRLTERQFSIGSKRSMSA